MDGLQEYGKPESLCMGGGSNVTALASQEQMGYTYDALKTYVCEMLELLIDSVRNPVFLDWEVNEQLQKVKVEIVEISNNPQGLLLEAIHSTGYSSALAYPLLASESALNRLNSLILEEFVTENYTAPRMVLAASGVEHEDLLSIAEPLLSDLHGVPHLVEPRSQYVAGDFRCQANSLVMLQSGKYDLVYKFFGKMRRSGATPKALTYKVLVRAFWEEGKVNEAVEAVRDMERRGVVGIASVYYELARCLCKNGRWKEAMLGKSRRNQHLLKNLRMIMISCRISPKINWRRPVRNLC